MWLCAFAVALTGAGVALGSGPPDLSESFDPVERARPADATSGSTVVPLDPNALAPTPRYGSRITFHGWSTNSRYLAYERHRMRPPDKSARRRSKEVKPQVQRRHRRVQDGKMTGFGSANGLDVAAYAADNGYIVNAAGYTTADNHKIYYDEAAGSLVIETSLVDDKVWWELRQGSRLITRRPFDKLYVDIEIDVYLAPNGRQGVVVMHLNAGYIVDAAIYAFKLRKRAVTAKPQSTDQ